MAQVVKRSEIWVVNLEPRFGKEIGKKRPALIISENSINQKSPSVIVIPASSQVPQHVGPEMILIGKREGLTKTSVLLPILIRSIDRDRLGKKIGKLSKVKLTLAEDALRLVLDLESD